MSPNMSSRIGKSTTTLRVLRSCLILAIGWSVVVVYRLDFESSVSVSAPHHDAFRGSQQPTKAHPSDPVSPPPPPRQPKFFALHLGPSKTGTSSIQEDLCRNPFVDNTLQDDRVIYVGRRTMMANGTEVADPYGDRKIVRTLANGAQISVTPLGERQAYLHAIECMSELLKEHRFHFPFDGHDDLKGRERIHQRNRAADEHLETNATARARVVHRLRDCWAENSYLLEHSLLDSNEQYSYSPLGPIQAGGILRAMDLLGYERTIVVGAYRRYADWLVSSYHQYLKPAPCAKRPDALCPVLGGYLRHHVRNKRGFSASLGHYLDVSSSLPMVAKDANASGRLESRILNHFQRSDSASIQEELYCDALGKELLFHTCRNSQLSNHPSNSSASADSFVANKGSTAKVVYQHIVTAGYLLGYLEDENTTRTPLEGFGICAKMKKCHQKPPPWLTELPRAAKPSNSTVRTWRDLFDYHTRGHQTTWIDSLPLVCPSPEFLQQFLEKSLRLENHTLPGFAASPAGRPTHEKLFWEVWHRAKKRFCWVDIERLFRNATSWEEILDDRMVRHEWPELSSSMNEE